MSPARWRTTGAVLLAATAGAAAPAARADAPVAYHWTGAATGAAGDWSAPANWADGAIPGTDPADLVFSTPGCSQPECLQSVDTIPGVVADHLSIADDVPYRLSSAAAADELTLSPSTSGAETLAAAPSGASPATGAPTFGSPIELSGAQRWSVAGGGLTFAAIAAADPSQDALDVGLRGGATLTLAGPTSVGPLTIEGDAGTAGDHAGDNGTAVATADVNGGGQPVQVDDTELTVAAPAATTLHTGPLDVEGGLVDFRDDGSAMSSLHVDGDLTVGADSALDLDVRGPGQADVDRIAADGAVALGGSIEMTYTGGPGCPSFPVGTTVPLITGSTVDISAIDSDTTSFDMACGGSTRTVHLRLSVSADATTLNATVVPSTATALTVGTSTAHTNVPVKITAVVTQDAGTPRGTVEFDDNSEPIDGCGAQPVAKVGGTYTATCTTRFTPDDAPALSATFAPDLAADAGALGSSSGDPQPLEVDPDPTTTSLRAGSAHPAVGAPVTVTATVAARDAGPEIPGGEVDFSYADGTPITCTGADDGTLSGATPDVATCTTALADDSPHQIVAAYAGDEDMFLTSTSAPLTVTATRGSGTGGSGGGSAGGGSGGSGGTGGSGGDTGGTTTIDPTDGGADDTTTTIDATGFDDGSTDYGDLSGLDDGGGPDPVTIDDGSSSSGRPTGAAATIASASTSGASARLALQCARGAGSCRVTVRLTASTTVGRGRHAVHRTVTLGTARRTIAAGGHAALRVTLNGAGRRMLARAHTLATTLTISGAGGGRSAPLATRRLTFRAGAARHRGPVRGSIRLAG